MITKLQASELLEQEEDGLLAMLGTTVADQYFAFRPIKPELIALGRRWLQEHEAGIKKHVCENEVIQAVLSKERLTDDMALLIAICTCLGRQYDTTITGIVAAWIVHKGLTSYCGLPPRGT